jgi:PKD domain
MKLGQVVAAAAAAVCVWLASPVGPAWASAGGSGGNGGVGGQGSFGPTTVSAGGDGPAGVEGPGLAVSSVGPPDPAPARQSGYTWQPRGSIVTDICLPNGQIRHDSPVPSTMGATGAAGIATLYVLYGPNGQQLGATEEVCPTKAAPAAASPPPPPPPPPTAAEAWASAPLPVAALDVNPMVGLTQLQSWFWFTGPTHVVMATADIRGYRVTTTAKPVGSFWYFGDGGSSYGAIGGTETDPAVRHTYVNVGHYQLSLYVQWSGQFTFSGYGTTQTVNLGTVDGPLSGVSYGVQEVRGVGVDPASGG